MSSKTENEVVKVEAMDSSKKNSEIVDTDEDVESTKKFETKSVFCWYNGRQYSVGSQVCSGSRRLYCNPRGLWANYGKC